MGETLTIKEVAKLLKLSYSTVYNNRSNWGFFEMEGVRGWRIYKTDLDKIQQKKNNVRRSGVRIGDKEKQCRSAKTNMAFGKSTLQRRQGNALDRLVARLTSGLRKSCTTS